MKKFLQTFLLGDVSRPDPDYPLSPVPQSARRGLVSISAVLLGFTFFYPTMFAGARIGSAYCYWPDLFIVIGCGSLILGLYVATLSAISARTGLTTVLLARYSFGKKGARWADLILGGTSLGILIPPMGGVILGDYFLVRKRKLQPLETACLPDFRPSALGGYAAGVLFAYLSELYSFMIPPLNGILVAGIAHALFCRVPDPSSQR